MQLVATVVDGHELLCTQGETIEFYIPAGPTMARALKRNIANDLATLKDLLESGADRE